MNQFNDLLNEYRETLRALTLAQADYEARRQQVDALLAQARAFFFPDEPAHIDSIAGLTSTRERLKAQLDTLASELAALDPQSVSVASRGAIIAKTVKRIDVVDDAAALDFAEENPQLNLLKRSLDKTAFNKAVKAGVVPAEIAVEFEKVELAFYEGKLMTEDDNDNAE